MVVAALLSVGMFAATASLPKKSPTVNGKAPKTEISKHHKQDKPKTATKHKTSTKKTNTKPVAKK